MSNDIYISGSAAISNNIVYKNGRSLFEQKAINVSEFLITAYHHFGMNYPKFYKMDAISKLGLLAAEILLKDGFKIEHYKTEDVGIVLSNANSSLDTDLKYFETTKEMASPALFVYTLPNIVIGEISIKHKLKGENAFFVSEKFDAGFMQQYVSNLFNNNILQACICGWVEVFGEEYKTVLFLVEKMNSDNAQLFTIENINKIYEIQNG
ncbi:MAG TPA: hypothetical protein VK559_07410 [Ferruginibacter sp.]|nr:hypothetical protein [Ferruginibacter sp.]